MNLEEMKKKFAALVAQMKELNEAETFDAEAYTAAETEAKGLKGKIVDAENRAKTMSGFDEFLDAVPTPHVSPKVNDTVYAEPKDHKPIFASLGEQIRAVVLAESKNGAVDNRLYEVQNSASGLGETTPADGGFLVETDKANTMIESIYAGNGAILAPKVDRLNLSARSNGIKVPGVDESSRANGSRGGGVTVYWEGEADALTASKTKWRMIELKLKKVMGACYMTDELLEDTVALESWVTKGFNAEMGFTLDDAIFRGDGVGKPLGVLNADCLVSVAKETGQAADTILADNVEKMFARMPASMLAGAEWFINQDCWPQIFQLSHVIGTGGAPVYMRDIQGSPFGSILGRPVTPIEHASTVGDLGDIVFANLKAGYITADKGGIKQASSLHVRFLYDEQVLRFTYRVDGQPKYPTYLTPYQGTNYQSPFVALAERA